jgi:hypothetical protein
MASFGSKRDVVPGWSGVQGSFRIANSITSRFLKLRVAGVCGTLSPDIKLYQRNPDTELYQRNPDTELYRKIPDTEFFLAGRP